MKKETSKKSGPDLLNEYDFSKGIRGKYTERYAQGSNVVVLPPDLARAFPTPAAVHDALRGLVALAERTTEKPSGQRATRG